MKHRWIQAVFWASGIYDLGLGIAFLMAGRRIFTAFQVTPPNHWGYIQFPALLLIVFGAMFIRIGTDPARFRILIPYGMGLKAAYCTVVFYHQAAHGIPALWVPFAWLDLAFLLLFLAAWRTVRTP